MYRTAAIGMVVLFLTGCVSTKRIPLSNADRSALNGKVAKLSVYAPPTFIAATAGKAAVGGLVGSALMMSSGNKLVRDNNVQDPARSIAQQIGGYLADQYGLVVDTAAPDVADSHSIRALVKTYHDCDLILDVETIGWGCVYYPMHWTKYRVVYGARLRLIEPATGRILAQDKYQITPEYREDAPSYDDLTRDDNG